MDLQCIGDKSNNKNEVDNIEKKADKLISETSEDRPRNEDKVPVKKDEKNQR